MKKVTKPQKRRIKKAKKWYAAIPLHATWSGYINALINATAKKGAA